MRDLPGEIRSLWQIEQTELSGITFEANGRVCGTVPSLDADGRVRVTVKCSPGLAEEIVWHEGAHVYLFHLGYPPCWFGEAFRARAGGRLALKNRTFTSQLTKWHERNRRDFSWRRTTDPYRILIAEVMLQKTTAGQAEAVYHKFLSRFPTPRALSEAPLRTIEAAIRPLGIEHLRAERLKRLATHLIKHYDAKVPENAEDLMSLPGVGRYIANGVLCFAYGHDLPMVDTNIVRVIHRIFGLASTKARPRTDEAYWTFAGKLIPEGRGPEVNRALLDFASLVCQAKKPKCPICPMRSICLAYEKVFSKG